MPKTGTERQRAWRQRQARRTTTLEADNAQLRAELAGVRADLADALTEATKLTTQACKHPAPAVDAGTCQACGAELW